MFGWIAACWGLLQHRQRAGGIILKPFYIEIKAYLLFFLKCKYSHPKYVTNSFPVASRLVCHSFGFLCATFNATCTKQHSLLLQLQQEPFILSILRPWFLLCMSKETWWLNTTQTYFSVSRLRLCLKWVSCFLGFCFCFFVYVYKWGVSVHFKLALHMPEIYPASQPYRADLNNNSRAIFLLSFYIHSFII